MQQGAIEAINTGPIEFLGWTICAGGKDQVLGPQGHRLAIAGYGD